MNIILDMQKNKNRKKKKNRQDSMSHKKQVETVESVKVIPWQPVNRAHVKTKVPARWIHAHKHLSHAKKSHSRYTGEKGKNRLVLSPKTVLVSEDVVIQKVEKKKVSRFHSFRYHQKEVKNALKKQRLDKIEKSREKLNVAKDEVVQANQSVMDAKQQIRQLKQFEQEKKKALKDAKRQVKQSKKAVKKAKKKNLGIVSSILVSLFATFAVLIHFTVKWLFATWPKLSADELVFQITSPMEGTGGGMVEGYLRQAAIPAVVGLLVIVVMLIVFYQFNRRVRRIGKSVLCIIAAVSLVISGNSFWQRLDITTYIENQTIESEFIEKEYADPKNVSLTFPEQKRNLVYIFLESMEVTYADYENGGAMEQNLIPNLTRLAEENECFSDGEGLNGGYSMPGTTWTMGGMFAATTGLPLQVDAGHNAMSNSESFYPGVTAIGDILKQNGYHNVFACGSNGAFGGREKYYHQHGDYGVNDYFWAVATGLIPPDYYVWWGFEDRFLIEGAKQTLTELASQSEPFNYTMLTVDTHFEDGYPDPYTIDRFGNQYANVIFHSDEQVSEFVSWIQQQPWYENTTIVISGDHPTMDSDFLNDIETTYQRRVYTTYINAAKQVSDSQQRVFTTMDNFPTTLSALGVEIEGNRLGLGTDLFSGEPTLAETYGLDTFKSKVSQHSAFLSNMYTGGQETSTYALAGTMSMKTANVALEKVEENGNPVFSVSDLMFTNGNFDYLSATLTDESGNSYVGRAEYDKNGQYRVKIPYEGALDYISLRVDAHLFQNNSDLLQKETVFSYAGNACLISENQKDLVGYLHGLRNLDQNRYAILMASQGDFGLHMTEAQKEALKELWIPETFLNTQSQAWYALLTNGGYRIRMGSGYIRETDILPNGVPYVISASANSEQVSSIQVNNMWEELSDEYNGINIVVWDMNTNSCVSRYYYDTTAGDFIMQLSAKKNEDNQYAFTLQEIDHFITDGDPSIALTTWSNETNKLVRRMTMQKNGGQWTGSLSADEVEDCYIIVYLLESGYGWRRVTEGKLDGFIVDEQEGVE